MGINFRDLKKVVKELHGTIVVDHISTGALQITVYFMDEHAACIFKLKCNHKCYMVTADALQRILDNSSGNPPGLWHYTWHNDIISTCI